MSIYLDETARIAVFGGASALRGDRFERLPFFAQRIVAAVEPDFAPRGPKTSAAPNWLLGSVPRFAAAAEARRRSGATVAAVLSPPERAGAVLLDCIAAGFELIVVFSEELFYQDRQAIRAALEGRSTRVIGPGSLGLVCPGQGQVGFLQSAMQSPGPVAILSRSAPLAYDAALQTSAQGLGQSCIVDLGARPLDRRTMAASLAGLKDDPATGAVVLVGDGDGRVEDEAAAYLRSVSFRKPVVAFLMDALAEDDVSAAPDDPRVVQLSGIALARKVGALRAAGVVVVEQPEEIGRVVARELARRRSDKGRSLGKSDFVLALRRVEESVYNAL